MSPLILANDEILIQEIQKADLFVGNIVLFLDQGSKELTLHRLINKPFTTKGDYSLLSETNPEENILGLAIGYRRGNFYRELPLQNSLFSKFYLMFSRMRVKEHWGNKLAKLILIFLTKYFEFYNGKTKLDHSEMQKLSDL